MRLGQGISEMVDAVHERVEVSWHHETWHVTAASFEAALGYAQERFDDPVVLSRRDHGRRRTRVTLEVTTDATRSAEAPPLDRLAAPPEPPAPRQPRDQAPQPEPVEPEPPVTWESEMPAALEAIFASQDDWAGTRSGR